MLKNSIPIVVNASQKPIDFNSNILYNGRVVDGKPLVLQPIPKFLAMFHIFDLVLFQVRTLDHQKLSDQ
jgi:hypothetical protein